MSSQPLYSNHQFGKDCLTEEYAYHLAYHLVPWTGSPFWDHAARSILVVLILKLQQEKGSDWGKADLIALASEPKQTDLRDVKQYLPADADLLRGRKTPSEHVLINLLIALDRDDSPLEAHSPKALTAYCVPLTTQGARS